MEFDRSINMSLAVSVALHSFLLIKLPADSMLRPLEPAKTVEVTYFRPRTLNRIPKTIKKTTQPKQVVQPEKPAPKQPVKIEQRKAPELKVAKAVKEKVTVSAPEFKAELVDDSAYMNYFQSLREEIRAIARRHCPGYFKNAEVFVAFTVMPNGRLKDVRVIEERTTAGSRLKNIAIRAVREASPFSSFPEEIDSPELDFQLAISFQNK